MTDHDSCEIRRRSALNQFVVALDRCEHGRHSRDSCFDCPGGQSTGNLFLSPGARIGTTYAGVPIVAPGQMDRGNVENWTDDGRNPT